MRPSFSQPPTAGEPSAKSQRHVSSSAAESSLFLPGMPAFIKVCPQICCLTSVWILGVPREHNAMGTPSNGAKRVWKSPNSGQFMAVEERDATMTVPAEKRSGSALQVRMLEEHVNMMETKMKTM